MSDAPKRTPAGSWQEGMREAGPYLGLGMQLALTMVFFSGGGYLLDRRLGTTPWLFIVGAVLGMVAVFAQIIRISTTANKREEGKGRRKGSGG